MIFSKIWLSSNFSLLDLNLFALIYKEDIFHTFNWILMHSVKALLSAGSLWLNMLVLRSQSPDPFCPIHPHALLPVKVLITSFLMLWALYGQHKDTLRKLKMKMPLDCSWYKPFCYNGLGRSLGDTFVPLWMPLIILHFSLHKWTVDNFTIINLNVKTTVKFQAIQLHILIV